MPRPEQDRTIDRILKALDHLGAEKTTQTPGKGIPSKTPDLTSRIGGLLALERISQDSAKHDKGRDHVAIMEIICAYVRENAPASDAQANPFAKNDSDDGKPIPELRSWAASLPPPRGDIAIALRIIGRRNQAQLLAEVAWPNAPTAQTIWPFATPCPDFPQKPDSGVWDKKDLTTFQTELETWKENLDYSGYRPDLRQTNLQGADLAGLNLARIMLDGARLEGANLDGAQMQGAGLIDAQLQRAKLDNAQLQYAFFCEAQMQGASLNEAQMQGVILDGAQMQGASLCKAQMQGASLDETQMQGANLYRVQMQGANLDGAQMQGANLNNAQMQGANLYGARMQGASLRATQLQGANLTWARLYQIDFNDNTSVTGANFTNVALYSTDCSMLTLSPEQIASTFGDATNTLPDGITPDHPDWPQYWAKRKLKEEEFVSERAKWHDAPERKA